MDLSICIPTLDRRNGRADRLIRSVVQHTRLAANRYEIVVEDCQGVLRGYTEPMNKAAARARGQWLLAVNDDVEVSEGWLEGLLCSAVMEPDIWCVTPDNTHTDGPQVFHPYCMLWRTMAWRAMGGLDEQFVLWCSDIDIARRLIDVGHPPLKVKLAHPITHELNATSREHPSLGQVCVEDLNRFRTKWGVNAEDEKHRLAALVQA